LAEDMFVIALAVVGALILLFANMQALKKYEVREGERSLPQLISEALEKGRASGIVSYPTRVCLNALIDFEYPCKNREGIFAKLPYCFEGNREYKVEINRNEAGGVCIEVKEVE